LYRAAHFLKINNLRKVIAAVAASRVYIPATLQAYNQKMIDLGVTEKLTSEKSKEYKGRFPFMS